MDHLVYLDTKAKELNNLLTGKKTMIIRGAMGRKYPYGKLNRGEVLYFIENKGDGLVKAKAIVKDVFNSPKLTKHESLLLVADFQCKLLLNAGMMKRFGGKRYIVLIEVKEVAEVVNFKIDRSSYNNMDDWIPLKSIEEIKRL